MEIIVNTTDNNQVWIRDTLTIVKDYSTNDIMLYEYIYNIDEEKTIRLISSAAIDYEYEKIGLIDMTNKKVVLIDNQASKGNRVYKKDYDDVVRDFFNHYATQDDEKDFLKKMDFELLSSIMSQNKNYEVIARTIEDGINSRYKRVSFSHYNRKSSYILFTRVDITDSMNKELQHKFELSKAIEKIANDEDEKNELIEEKERLTAALFNQIPMIISANLTKNTYSMLNYESYTTKKAKYSGVFDELIQVGVSTVPDEFKQKFFDTFNRTNLLKQYESGASSVSLEHQQFGDDGITRWILTKVVFVKSSITDDVYEITLSTDIDNEKKQKIELKNALDAAEKAIKAKSDFLARMSHDLRTPMNAIVGLTSLTIDDVSKPDEVLANMSKMRSASDYMLGLINDLLDMSRIEEGKMSLNLEEYSYKEFMLNLKTIFIPECEQKGITISFMEPKYNPVIFTDKTHFNQIFFNIFSNAFKYTNPGGSISYSTENFYPHDSVLDVDMIIEDTGVGMSEEFQKKMFEPFTQESKDYTSQLQGSGLGLSITKKLVELLGGKLTITSKKGVGTKVCVHMTLQLINKDYNQTIDENAPIIDYSVLYNKNVLLVEDHPINAMIASRILQKQKMNVVHMENGQLAVGAFASSAINTFDFILMDIRMPVMDGYEATKKIRSLDRPDAKTVPIIAMSANAYPEDVSLSLACGMNGHLAKPVEPNVLFDELVKTVRKR